MRSDSLQEIWFRVHQEASQLGWPHLQNSDWSWGRSRRQIQWRGLVEDDILAHSNLLGLGIMAFITLLFIWLADQYTLPSFTSHRAHVHRQCSRIPSSVVNSVSFRNKLMSRLLFSDPILDVDCGLYRFGPIELGHALLFPHLPCRFHNQRFFLSATLFCSGVLLPSYGTRCRTYSKAWSRRQVNCG